VASRQWNNANNGIPHHSYIARSKDNGKTFTPRKIITFPEFEKNWSPFGKIIELGDGTLLMAGYGRKKGDDSSSSACMISGDRGQSWKFLSWVAEYNCIPKVQFNEVFILKLITGDLFAILRTNGLFYTTRSTDSGRSWELPISAFAGNACAGLVLSTGEILVTYRGIRDPKINPDKGRMAGIPHKGHLYNFRISYDMGQTWSEEVEIDGNEAHMVGSYGMGDIVELKDGSVKVVYYTSDHDQAPWIEECLLVPYFEQP
jgi:hypothetical protein